jgi:hypothetical protein
MFTVILSKKLENCLKHAKILKFSKIDGEKGRISSRSRNFSKLEPEPHKNGPAPQHWLWVHINSATVKRETFIMAV